MTPCTSISQEHSTLGPFVCLFFTQNFVFITQRWVSSSLEKHIFISIKHLAWLRKIIATSSVLYGILANWRGCGGNSHLFRFRVGFSGKTKTAVVFCAWSLIIKKCPKIAPSCHLHNDETSRRSSSALAEMEGLSSFPTKWGDFSFLRASHFWCF